MATTGLPGKRSLMTRKLWSPVRVRRLVVVIALGLGFVSARPAAAQMGYVVEDLGALAGDTSSVAWAINANGDVVGWSMGQAGPRAFLYTSASGLVALPSLPNRPRSVARDINDAGVIVGSANAGGTDIGHAVVWSGGSVQDLGTLGTGFFSEALGVNNLGQVVGWSYTVLGNGLREHAFLYTQADGMVDLTPDSDTGSAADINDAGQVTGYKTAPYGSHAFRWEQGVFLDLGVLPFYGYSEGWAINASGRVAGNSTSSSGNSENFVRYTDGSGLQDLGGGGEHNVAWGMNASGTVVGTRGQSASRAVLYTDAAGLQDLDTLIDPSLGWVLMSASDINDAGQIVGQGFNNFTGQSHAVRLQPTAAPPPGCTFQCLRSTLIDLQSGPFGSRMRRSVTGRVTVKDENGALISTALVVGRWTQPDGSTHVSNAVTNSNGVALFTTEGPPGTYSLMVVNILRQQYTFDPAHSVLSNSITLR
jgi:probable HAF family extracellular repeat protein